MKIKASTVDEYFENIPEDRKEPMQKLRKTILDNMSEGIEEGLGYGMPAYYVPHSKYAGGYHCDPKLPLPFVNIASQKNFIAFYHMGIYANQKLLDWFVEEYPKHCKCKLDMGKSCIRFKKIEDIPYGLVAQVMQKMSADDWIELYEANIKK